MPSELSYYCNGCGEFFIVAVIPGIRTAPRFWCSKKCMYRWQHPRPETTICPHCKQSFPSDYDDRRNRPIYCSSNCAQAGWKQRFYAANGYEYSYNTYRRYRKVLV